MAGKWRFEMVFILVGIILVVLVIVALNLQGE